MTRGQATARVLLCTTPSLPVAQRLAKALVQRRLAACVSCVPGARSYFWWQGRLDIARETLMVIKTPARQLPAAMQFLKASHPYTVPELIALPVVTGHRSYLAWMTKVCRA